MTPLAVYFNKKKLKDSSFRKIWDEMYWSYSTQKVVTLEKILGRKGGVTLKVI